MSETRDGGPAFTQHEFRTSTGEYRPTHPGMSLRDWFAGQAMAAAMMSEANPHLAAARLTAAQKRKRSYEAQLAVEAYQIADAMLAARVPSAGATAQEEQ